MVFSAILKNSLLAVLVFLFSANDLLADVPKPWQISFQEPATEWMSRVESLHDHIMLVLFIIIFLIMATLTYVSIRFSAKRNPIPNKFSHNTLIEVVWTGIPILIILSIAYPSIKLLRYQEIIPESEMTLKITGHQWHWNYIYPDLDKISFDSRIRYKIADDEYKLLEVDNRVVLPINTNIKLLVTAADVIHSWSVPAFGAKQDAIPGRLSETWINIKEEGVYRGQCFELCGRLHGFMPIVVEAVSKEKFKLWAENVAKKKFA